MNTKKTFLRWGIGGLIVIVAVASIIVFNQSMRSPNASDYAAVQAKIAQITTDYEKLSKAASDTTSDDRMELIFRKTMKQTAFAMDVKVAELATMRAMQRDEALHGEYERFLIQYKKHVNAAELVAEWYITVIGLETSTDDWKIDRLEERVSLYRETAGNVKFAVNRDFLNEAAGLLERYKSAYKTCQQGDAMGCAEEVTIEGLQKELSTKNGKAVNTELQAGDIDDAIAQLAIATKR